MLEDGYVDDLVQRITQEWGDSSTVHSILTPSDVKRSDRAQLASELQQRLQAMFPDDFVTAHEYGVGDIKVSKERS